jgi:tetratricopeptide (TPR) repeat protein
MRLQGAGDVARKEFDRALAITESVLGPHHPDVARNLTHVGLLLYQQGDYLEARKYFERALSIEERALGKEHYGLITRLNYLGRCLKRLGEIDQSVACYTRSAGILRKLRENRTSSNGSGGGEASADPTTEVAGLLG